MVEHVIEIANLSRRFGSTSALDDVELQVEAGCVFGLVGENGAGKTTLLKHILGLYRPQQGRVSVFGYQPDRHPVETLSRIGYLSEDRALPGWMTVQELCDYTAAFYPSWDSAHAAELRELFQLGSKQKTHTLSRGQLARLGLLLALAYRPDLLILDEPSSGLDPIVRSDILTAIIRTVADEGRTVLFSSHLLDEVQRVADRFAMLQSGRVCWDGKMDDAMSSHSRLVVRFPSPLQEPPQIRGALHVTGGGREWTVVCNGEAEQVAADVGELGGEVVDRSQPSLEEIFVARAQAKTMRSR